MDALMILTTIFSINAPFSISPIQMDEGAFFNTVAIRGTVRAWANGPRESVGDALVYAVSETSVEATVSDRDGHFLFLSLLPGNYRLGARATGYSTSCGIPNNPRKPVELNAGSEYSATVYLPKNCM